MANIGKITQIIGPVVDVSFEAEGATLPNILDALEIERPGGALVMEVQQHIGEDTVRAIAMDSTDGLTRGTPVRAMGALIRMPAGDAIKGRLFNVVGDAIDGIGSVSKDGGVPIHRTLPASRTSPPNQKYCSPVSKSSTSSNLTPKAVRSVCSAAQV